eukprot:1188206-Prorocentrum_minimum.AAC.4
MADRCGTRAASSEIRFASYRFRQYIGPSETEAWLGVASASLRMRPNDWSGYTLQELLAQCESGAGVLPKDYTYLFVAGLFNEFYPGYLREAVEHFNQRGVRASLASTCLIKWVNQFRVRI